MSAQKVIFDYVFNHSKEQLKFVKDVFVYRSQEFNTDSDIIRNYPAIGVDFSNPINIQDRGRYKQYCETLIMFKIFHKGKSVNRLDIFNIKQLIIESFNLTSWGSGQFIRVEEVADDSFDGMYVYDVIFSTNWYEDITQKYETEIDINGICLQIEADANNDGTNTQIFPNEGTFGCFGTDGFCEI
jgi:hypothetical protein